MAAIRIYAMTFSWQAIKTIRLKAGIRGIVFQPENDDKSTHPRRRSDYILTAFELYGVGVDPVEITDPAVFYPDTNHTPYSQKVKFGNLYFTNSLIDRFINYEQQNPGIVIESLLFVPNPKNTGGKFEDYVTYKIKTVEHPLAGKNKKTTIMLHEEDLNPSPPAPPPA